MECSRDDVADGVVGAAQLDASVRTGRGLWEYGVNPLLASAPKPASLQEYAQHAGWAEQAVCDANEDVEQQVVTKIGGPPEYAGCCFMSSACFLPAVAFLLFVAIALPPFFDAVGKAASSTGVQSTSSTSR